MASSITEEFNYTPNEKLHRISMTDAMALPESYRSNTAKEELMLQCASC